MALHTFYVRVTSFQVLRFGALRRPFFPFWRRALPLPQVNDPQGILPEVSSRTNAAPEVGERHSVPTRRVRRVGKLLLIVGTTTFVPTFILAILAIHFGSWSIAAEWFAGERLIILPRVASFGEGRVGERHKVSLQVTNLTREHVRILGATDNCSCVATRDLPVIVEPNETVELRVTVYLTHAGHFEQPVVFLTSFKGRSRLSTTISGAARESEVVAERAHIEPIPDPASTPPPVSGESKRPLRSAGP